MASVFKEFKERAAGNSDDDAVPREILEFREQIKRGSGFSLETVSAVIDVIRNKDALDDRKFLLEQALTFVSRLEPGKLADSVQSKIIQLLYNDLTHPPATVLGKKYAFREADGRGNNIDIPDMGRAGTAYSRSVQQKHALPQNRLPDPGLVFDTLLRRDEFVEHPAGLSSMMFAFAALVIHTVFRTSHTDANINETSSYVDLSPLYGSNQNEQDSIRDRSGFGKLYPDVFAEKRLLLLPPACCVILVLFSRNHNYIAEKLFEINERGNWVHPSTLNPQIPDEKVKLIQQDEEIFQTARLINIGWFGTVVFSDYFSCILGLVRDGNSWSLSPFEEIRVDHELFERGKGNNCSVEFNCLYRWHATTSLQDEKWVDTVIRGVFKDCNPDEVTPEMFKEKSRELAGKAPNIKKWTFGTLTRKEDGFFPDDQLAKVLHDATEEPAGAFGARHTPGVMRLHEIMGIEQNRQWGTCSLNEFRKFLGLKVYTNFKEWNPRDEIWQAAEKLYGHVDNLELYVGLQAEDSKPVIEGAGLCPGYTISRAILSDAIALTRGDRFFTHDFTPYNLTAWGFADCQRDPNAFGFGSTLGRLFLRNLPNHFSENSIYTFFPLMTPKSMTENLSKLDVLEQYSLERPIAVTPTQVVQDYGTAAEILKKPAGWAEPYKARVERVLLGSGFYTVEGEERRRQVINALAPTPQDTEKIAKHFFDYTRNLIQERSIDLVGSKTRVVDLVREVLRTAPLRWAAGDIAGISVKSPQEPNGAFTAEELFARFSDIYSFIYLDIDAAKVMVTQKAAHNAIHELLHHIKGPLGSNVSKRFSVAGLVGTVSSIFFRNRKLETREIVKRLEGFINDPDEIANTLLAISVVTSIELPLAITNVINVFIGAPNEAEIIALAKSNDAKSSEKLSAYILEALRIDPPLRGVYRTAIANHNIGQASFPAKGKIFLDLAAANRNETVFPQAATARHDRPQDAVLQGDGVLKNLGEQLTVKIISSVVRAVYSYDKVTRAPGNSGQLQRFQDPARRELSYAYLDDNQEVTPWPTSLTVKFQSS